jgi:hypothetical protein
MGSKKLSEQELSDLELNFIRTESISMKDLIMTTPMDYLSEGLALDFTEPKRER